MTKIKISEIQPGQTIVFEWASKTISRPAKYMEVKVESCKYSHYNCGADWWLLTGEFKPLWGNGKYETTKDSTQRTSGWTVELID